MHLSFDQTIIQFTPHYSVCLKRIAHQFYAKNIYWIYDTLVYSVTVIWDSSIVHGKRE